MSSFDITDMAEVRKRSLKELERESYRAIMGLPDEFRELWMNEHARAVDRGDRLKILSLILEFQETFAYGPTLRYSVAFVDTWNSQKVPLYKTRWWINEYAAGVYFIYDESQNLRYVGSSCGGALGCRIYHKCHHDYRCATDVVLFEREFCHLALAFEALAISRLKPPQNGRGKNLWIPAPSPFDRIWIQPQTPPSDATRHDETITDGIG